jgi:phage-related protein
LTILGDAYIKIHIIGDPAKELRRKMQGVKGGDIGDKLAWDFNKGFRRGISRRPFGISEGFFQEIKEARDRLQSLIRLGFFLGPAITAIVGAIGGLIGALTTLVTVVGAATPALTALLSVLSAVGQAAIVGAVAFRGVGEALRAGIQAEKESANNQDAIAAALKRVEQARIRLRNVINKEQPERLAEARERALRAEESAADALINSQRSLRAYNEAQKRTLDALENLNDARERARQRIKDLRFELEGGAISEKRARLQFERARDALQRVQDLPPNSRARQEAELAFAEADLNLRRAIDRNGNLRQEEAKATREGVEGSNEVVSAKEAITNAIQAEQDAQINAAKAFRDAARARAEADKAAADAAEGGRVQQEINAQIATAREQLQDALDDLNKAQSGGGAAKAFQDALDDLSPAARDFVLYLIEIRKEFRRVRDAAAEGLFPNLTPAVQNIVDIIDSVLVPLFGETGRVLGETARSFSDTFVEAENLANLQTAWRINDRLIRNLGGAFEGLLEGVLALLAAAGPLATRFGDWFESTMRVWGATKKADAASGELTERLNRAGDVAARLGGILRAMGQFFRELGRVIMAPGGAGDVMLDFLENAFLGMRDFLAAGEAFDGERTLVEYFRDLTVNGIEVLRWLGDLVVLFMNLGSGPGFKSFIDKLREATGIWQDTGMEIDRALDPFGDFIIQFSLLTRNLTESGAIESFFGIINAALEKVNSLFENETFVAIFEFLGQIKAISIALYSLKSVAEFFGKAFLGTFIAPLGAIKELGSKGVAQLDKVATGGGRFSTLATRIQLFGLKLAGLAAPILAIVAVIAVLAGWFYYLYQTNEEFKESFDKVLAKFMPVWEAIKEEVQIFIESLKEAWNSIKEPLMELYYFIEDNLIALFRKLGSDEEGGLGWLVDRVSAIFTALINIVGGVLSSSVRAIGEVIGDIIRGVREVIGSFIRIISGVVGIVAGIFNAIKNVLAGFFKIFIGLFTWNFDLVKEGFSQLWSGLKAGIAQFARGVVEVFRGFGEFLASPFRFFANVVNTIFRFILGILNGFARAWNNTIGSLSFTVPSWIPGIGGETFSMPRFREPLFNLAKGGIVPATPGGIFARIGEAGRPERVEPLDPSGLSQRDRAMISMLAQQSGMGATINVYPSPGMDERELASMVSRRLAYEMRTGAA